MRFYPVLLILVVLLAACNPTDPPTPTALPPTTAPTVNTYTNALLGIRLEYPLGWAVAEADGQIVFTNESDQVGMEILYGVGESVIPVADIVNEFKSVSVGVGNRPILSEGPVSLAGGVVEGIRLDLGPDAVDGEPAANSVEVFTIILDRNVQFRTFGDIPAFDAMLNSLSLTTY
jgi:hypothetical protein